LANSPVWAAGGVAKEIAMPLPPLDKKWAWETWDAALRTSDPWKSPYTMEELTQVVQRGDAAELRAWEMEEMLQVPIRVVSAILKMPRKPDPWREEIRSLTSLVRIENYASRLTGEPFLGKHAAAVERLIYMREMTRSQLRVVTDVADPEIVADTLRRQAEQLSDERTVDRYFNHLRRPPDELIPFPALDAEERSAPRDVKAGFEAISGVLAEQGLNWLDGYPPAAKGWSDRLASLVLTELALDPALAASLDAVPELQPSDLPPGDRIFAAAPPRVERPSATKAAKKVSRSWDRSAADAANKALGTAGEAFVVAAERRRLAEEGRADLAANVVWTARDEGDGAGYDVASFNADGSPRLIEVKTTNGNHMTPFYLTANEVRVSAARPGDYWLYRVFDFSRKTRGIYRLPGALNGGELTLTPTVYHAIR